MKRLNIAKAVAFLGVAGLAISQCAADTLVDTIGTGANYQLGKSLSRQVGVGYDKYPYSGDFTGVRPFQGTTPTGGAYNYTFNTGPKTWDASSQSAVWNVTHRGTTGVWTSEVLTGNTPADGAYAAWVAQPFTPATSGVVTAVQFIAEDRTPAWYVPTFYGGPTRASILYADVIDGDTCPPGWPTGAAWPHGNPWNYPSPIDIANCTVGTLVTVPMTKPVVAGHTYYLFLCPQQNLNGQMDANAIDYANVNWAWRSVAPGVTKAGVPAINNTNGEGTWVPMTSSVLGFRILGSTPTASTIKNAKGLPDGTLVAIGTGADTNYLAGQQNPDGLFWVEAGDRSTGIRVVGNAGTMALGEQVSFTGAMTTLAGGERAINLAGSVTDLSANQTIYPFGMNANSVCTLGNTGLHCVAWGKVSNASGREFDLSDGSKTTAMHCVIVRSEVALPANDSFIGVAGFGSLAGAGAPQFMVTGIRNY